VRVSLPSSYIGAWLVGLGGISPNPPRTASPYSMPNCHNEGGPAGRGGGATAPGHEHALGVAPSALLWPMDPLLGLASVSEVGWSSCASLDWASSCFAMV
jgi:hypothetical protein